MAYSYLKLYIEEIDNNKSGVDVIFKYINKLISIQENKINLDKNIIDFLNACLSEKLEDFKFKDTLKEYLPEHTRCCHVITNNEVVYSCNDCSFGESSCMCQKCFDPEKHEGHNYQYYKSEGNCCCDCGDIESWEEKWWCDDHKTAEDISNPECLLLPKLRQAFEDVMDVCAYLLLVLLEDVNGELHLTMQSLVQFVNSYFEISQSTARVISRSFTKQVQLDDVASKCLWKPSIHPEEPVSYTNLYMQLIAQNYQKDDITPLILCLLYDREYKEAFIPMYLKELPGIFVSAANEIVRFYQQFEEDSQGEENNQGEEDDDQEDGQDYSDNVEDGQDYSDNEEDAENPPNEEDSPQDDIEFIPDALSNLLEQMLGNEAGENIFPLMIKNKGPQLDAYREFVDSVHCQLFHSAAKIHLRDDFRFFIKRYIATLNQGMHAFMERTPKDTFMWGVSNVEFQYILCGFISLNTIIQENPEPAYAFFDEVTVNGVQTIQMIPEFVDLLSYLQCNSFMTWKSEQDEMKSLQYSKTYSITFVDVLLDNILLWLQTKSSTMSEAQCIAFVQTLLQGYLQKSKEMPYCDDNACSDSGVYVLHYHDYFLLSCLSIVLRRPSLIQPIQQLSELSEVLHICFRNALHVFYYLFYMSCLNVNRFTQVQLFVTDLWLYAAKTISFLDLHLFAFQVSMTMLDINQLLMDMFSFFMDGLVNTTENIPIGKENMIGYFLMLLLHIIYGRNTILFDAKSTLRNVVAAACCTTDRLTFNKILDLVSGIMPEDQLGEYLEELTVASFNTKFAKTLYKLKQEVIDKMLVYDFNPVVISQDSIMEFVLKKTNAPFFKPHAIPLNDALSPVFIQRLFSSPVLYAILQYLLQNQICDKYKDIKVVEIICTLIQVLCQIDSEIDIPEHVYCMNELLNSKELPEYGSKIRGHIRDYVWRGNDSIVACLKQIRSDSVMNEQQIDYTLDLCIRSYNMDDENQLTKVEKVEEKKVQPSHQQALANLSNNLDDFLAMYEEEEDEEQKEGEKPNSVPIFPEFICCSCHSGEIDSKDHVPVLLCHICENAAIVANKLHSLEIDDPALSMDRQNNAEVFKVWDARHNEATLHAFVANPELSDPGSNTFSLTSCGHTMHYKCYQQLHKYGTDDGVQYYHCPVCRRPQCAVLPLVQLYTNPQFRERLTASWSPEMKEKEEMLSILKESAYSVNHQLLTQMHSSVVESEYVLKQCQDLQFNITMEDTDGLSTHHTALSSILQMELNSRSHPALVQMNSQLFVKSFTEEGDAILNKLAISNLQHVFFHNYFYNERYATQVEADTKRRDILECFSLQSLPENNTIQPNFIKKIEGLCKEWNVEDTKEIEIPGMEDLSVRCSSECLVEPPQRKPFGEHQKVDRPYNYIRPYAAPYRMFTNYCFGQQADVITSVESATQFLDRVKSLLGLLQQTNLEFKEKRAKQRITKLINEFSCEMSQLEATEDDRKQACQLKLSALQSEILHDLVLNQSEDFISERKQSFETTNLVCLLRDPFSKLMAYLSHITLDDLQSVDSMYKRIVAAIQHYYVMAIHEIMMYIVLFCSTYDFDIREAPDFTKMQQTSLLRLYQELDAKACSIPFNVSKEYHKSTHELLKQQGIQATMEAFLTPFLRKCCILLYATTPQQEEIEFIVPQSFEKLRLFMELPKPEEYEMIYSTLPASRVLIEKAYHALISSLFIISKHLHFKSNETCIHVINELELMSIHLFIPLPKQLGIFNNFCHHFHATEGITCYHCEKCSVCKEECATPLICLMCGRRYCNMNISLFSTCVKKRNLMQNFGVCPCSVLMCCATGKVLCSWNVEYIRSFGSLYLTNWNTPVINSFPTVPLTLSEQSLSLLTSSIVSDMVIVRDYSNCCVCLINNDDVGKEM